MAQEKLELSQKARPSRVGDQVGSLFQAKIRFFAGSSVVLHQKTLKLGGVVVGSISELRVRFELSSCFSASRKLSRGKKGVICAGRGGSGG